MSQDGLLCCFGIRRLLLSRTAFLPHGDPRRGHGLASRGDVRKVGWLLTTPPPVGAQVGGEDSDKLVEVNGWMTPASTPCPQANRMILRPCNPQDEQSPGMMRRMTGSRSENSGFGDTMCVENSVAFQGLCEVPDFPQTWSECVRTTPHAWVPCGLPVRRDRKPGHNNEIAWERVWRGWQGWFNKTAAADKVFFGSTVFR